jgi:hypothetical protein
MSLGLTRQGSLFLDVNDTAEKKGEITEVSTEAYEKMAEYMLGIIAFGNLGRAKHGDECPLCLEGTVEVVPSASDPDVTDYFCRGGCQMTTSVGECH